MRDLDLSSFPPGPDRDLLSVCMVYPLYIAIPT